MLGTETAGAKNIDSTGSNTRLKSILPVPEEETGTNQDFKALEPLLELDGSKKSDAWDTAQLRVAILSLDFFSGLGTAKVDHMTLGSNIGSFKSLTGSAMGSKTGLDGAPVPGILQLL